MSDIKFEIKDEQLIDALSKRYLDYAISTIVDRALPDVRDGLKPVHRRLLFAMRELKLNPKTGHKKCARIVGDVIGKYHPHGDVAVYEAMVRLAQDFSVRYPLVDGQGNFGNIDGDGAAAMRYTEARLTYAGELLMSNLDENVVDFIPTYDGSETEPVVMPSSFPNLLANGAMGIAVGMATNIPPHNVEELCNGIINLIKKPDIDVAKLCDYIKGPDFPTGGIIIDKKDHIISVYEKGNGAFTVRCKWEKEDLSYGNYQIIINEIPYGVVKSKLIEKIADLMEQKKLPLIADIRDESSEDLRIVIEPKNRTVEAEIIMAHLFKLTELESKFNLNMNVLDSNSVPSVLNLKQVLVEFIEHRKNVLKRKSEFRLNNIERRLEILEGFLKAYLNLDRVIEIIRENDEPKPMLIAEFELSEIQAESILNMKLRSLRKLEEFEIKGEHENLSKEKEGLKILLGSQEKMNETIIGELENIKETMGKKTKFGKRRTQFVETDNDIVIDEASFIEKEPITVLITKGNWIRAVKGHADLNEKFPAKEGDEVKFVLHTMTTDKIIIALNNGKFYTIGADKITRGKGFGEPISLMIDFEDGVKIMDVFEYNQNQKLLVINSEGYGFVVNSDNILASTKIGKVVLNLDKGVFLERVVKIAENDDKVAIISNEKKMLVFNLDDIPELNRGKGVILQKYRDKQKMSDIITFNKNDGLYWITGRGKTVLSDFSLWDSKRANAGYMIPNNFPKSLKFN